MNVTFQNQSVLESLLFVKHQIRPQRKILKPLKSYRTIEKFAIHGEKSRTGVQQINANDRTVSQDMIPCQL